MCVEGTRWSSRKQQWRQGARSERSGSRSGADGRRSRARPAGRARVRADAGERTGAGEGRGVRSDGDQHGAGKRRRRGASRGFVGFAGSGARGGGRGRRRRRGGRRCWRTGEVAFGDGDVVPAMGSGRPWMERARSSGKTTRCMRERKEAGRCGAGKVVSRRRMEAPWGGDGRDGRGTVGVGDAVVA
nr:uncharacterized protein LOC120973618 [Aegilops tauschii subsp. strangulata]